MTKAWYKSRTLWWNLAAGIIVSIPWVYHAVGPVTCHAIRAHAALNLYLRSTTETPLGRTDGKPTS